MADGIMDWGQFGGGFNPYSGATNPPASTTFPTYDEWLKKNKFTAWGQELPESFWLTEYLNQKNQFQLKNSLSNGNTYTPNFADPTKFFDPTFIQQTFDIGRGNLARAQGGAVAGAQRSAGAIAGAQGLLNAAGFITGAGSQARQPYASAFGQLEQGRAGALNENQKSLFDALLRKQAMEEQSRQFGITSDEQKRQFEQNWLLQQQQFQQQRKQQESNWGDWVTGLLPAAASLINPFLGMGAVTLPSGTWGNRPSSIKSYTPPPLTSYNPYQTLGRR